MTATEKCLRFVEQEQAERETTAENILRAMESCFGYTATWFLQNDSAQPCTNHNTDPRMVNDYITCYYQMNPFKEPSRQKREVVFSDDTLCPAAYEQSEYYKAFVSRYGYYHVATVPLFCAKKCTGYIIVYRSLLQPAFGDDDREMLSFVGRYVSASVSCQMEVNAARDFAILLEASLQRVPFGFAVLGNSGEILYLNAPAQSHASKICNAHKVKQLSTDMPLAAFKELLRKKLHSESFPPMLPWELNSGSFHVYGRPVGSGSGHHMLCIMPGTECAVGNVVEESMLTGREAQIVSLLAKGRGNAKIAQQLGISEHTVKVHLRNIYAKMAVSSRAEVISLLGNKYMQKQ